MTAARGSRRSATLAPGPLALVAVVVIGAAAAAVARRTLLVIEVQGASMQPTYDDGDRLLAVRRRPGGRVPRGIAVVVRAPASPRDPGRPAGGGPDTFVKRVGAIGGDTRPDDPGVGVPGGMIFVQGDHPASYDSRAYGLLEEDAVVARVLLRFGRTAS